MSDAQKSWFTQDAFGEGEKNLEAARQAQKEQQARRTPRFWLKKGAGFAKHIMFVDDKPFGYYEHELKLNGQWGNFFTCLKGVSRCPLCDAGIRNYYVGLLTIVDFEGYEDDKGVRHKNLVRLFAAKMDTLDILKYKKANNGLLLCVYKVARLGDKAPRVGDNFDFVKKLNSITDLNVTAFSMGMNQQVTPKELKPFDYPDIAKPVTIEELERIAGAHEASDDGGSSSLGGGAPAGGGALAGAAQQDDDLPF